LGWRCLALGWARPIFRRCRSRRLTGAIHDVAGGQNDREFSSFEFVFVIDALAVRPSHADELLGGGVLVVAAREVEQIRALEQQSDLALVGFALPGTKQIFRRRTRRRAEDCDRQSKTEISFHCAPPA
jgi:hypothetical protein